MGTTTHTRRRWPLVLGVMIVLLAGCVGVLIARSNGVFDSRVTHWIKRAQSCGSVDTAPNGALLNGDAAEQAVTCFVAAQARCEAASLTWNAGGTDTETTYAFVIEPRSNGGCDVGLHSSNTIVGSQRTTTIETQCASLSSANGILTIHGCGGFNDFTLP